MRDRLVPAVLALGVASCFITTSFDRYDTGAVAPKLYAVHGTVDGLGGKAVTLLLNGGSAMSVGDGPFAFPPILSDGSGYTVTVASSPPDAACLVAMGAGTIAGVDGEGVAVHCAYSLLAALSISAAPLSPAFQPMITDYNAAARTSDIFTTTTTVTATTSDPREMITIAAMPATSGIPSAQIRIRGGETSIPVVVVGSDGVKQSKYNVIVSGSPNPNDYLKASNTIAQKQAQAQFGAAVVLSGDTLVVGAPAESSGSTGVDGIQSDTSVPGAGAVYVFIRSGVTWSQQAYIKASNTHNDAGFGGDASFGAALALSSDTLVVGAPGEFSNATGINGDQTNLSAEFAGAVYVFTRSGTKWTQQAYIKASNTPYGCINGFCARFGSSVALSGNTLVVGASGDNSNATGIGGDQTNKSAPRSGAAYVFTRSGTTWLQEAYIKASNTRASAFFGGVVALSGDTLVVGSPGESSGATGLNGNQSDTSAPNSGAAYVFTRTGSIWSQQAYIKASNNIPNLNGGGFGGSVAAWGDSIAVGASAESSSATGINGNQKDTSAPGSGAVYVFTRSGAVWAQQAYVKASNTRAAALFGGGSSGPASLALSGDTLVVGSRGESSNATGVNGNQTDTSRPGSGAAYVFVRNGTSWSQLAYVKASNIGGLFGSGVAVDGTTVAVGAMGEVSTAIGVNGNQLDMGCALDLLCGAAYVF